MIHIYTNLIKKCTTDYAFYFQFQYSKKIVCDFIERHVTEEWYYGEVSGVRVKPQLRLK